MKGRTTCPKCKQTIILDIQLDEKQHEVLCPKCENKFTIIAKCKDSSSKDECSWEEHGEPRKTVLSKVKTKTKIPMIAAILLICVFVIGITTAIFSQEFVDSSLDLASQAGFTGSVIITVTDVSNNSIENVKTTLGGVSKNTNNNGITVFEDIKLGVQTIEISKEDYKTQENEILVLPIADIKHNMIIEEGAGKSVTIHYDFTGCTLILAILSFFALFSAVACLRRQHVDLALMGSFIAIFSLGFFLIGFILSIIAFILIMMARDEFEDGKKGKVF
jgi:hypothetical protein